MKNDLNIGWKVRNRVLLIALTALFFTSFFNGGASLVWAATDYSGGILDGMSGLRGGSGNINSGTAATDNNEETSTYFGNDANYSNHSYSFSTKTISSLRVKTNTGCSARIEFRLNGAFVGDTGYIAATGALVPVNNITANRIIVFNLNTCGSYYLQEVNIYEAPDTAPPAVPYGLNSVAGDGSVTLTWSPVGDSDLKGYYVYKDSVKLNATPITSTSYTVTGLANGVAYNFQVSSVDIKNNESALSPVKTETPVSPPPPVPSGLEVTAGDKQAYLNWTANTDDTTKYHIYKNGVYLQTVTHPNTYYTATGLTNGTTYSFSITAMDAYGKESEKSAPVMVTPVEIPPTVPSGLTVTAGDGQAALTWLANTDDTTIYHIYLNGIYLNSVSHPTTSYTVTGLTNGTTYSFSISAEDEDGSESVKSEAVTVIPTEPLTQKPTGLKAIAGDGQVTLSWTANTDKTTKYHIYKNGVYLTTVTHPTTTYTVTGLSNGMQYSFTLKAEFASGQSSEASGAVNVTPAGPAPVTGIPAGGSANFGFSAADIFTNSVEIFGFLAAFVLLGIVFNQVAPKVFDLVRNSFK